MLLPQDTPEQLSSSASLDLEYLYWFFLNNPDVQSAHGITPNSSLSPHDAPNPPSLPSQTVTPGDEGPSLCTVFSASASTPQSQVATFPPLNWRKIPQKSFDRGQKQWDFKASAPVSFSMNGFPGVNMRDALDDRFTDLDGRDDIILQDTPRKAISCRLSVRSLL